MFNFKDALTYIFKEKEWGYKFLIPFIFELIIVIPGIFITFLQPEHLTNFGSMRSLSSTGMLPLFLACISLVTFIPYLFVQAWYIYENTQSGIFQRATKAIWRNNFEDTLKKSGKYLLTNMVYSLITILVLLFLTIVIGVVVFGCFILIMALMRTGSTTDILVLLSSGIGLVLLCSFVIIILIIALISYIWIAAGISRLIATNSLSEGMKFQDNWRIGMKHKWKFISVFMLVIIATIITSTISSTVGAFTESFMVGMPVLDFSFKVMAAIITAMFSTYLVAFVYPRLLGQLYRHIIQKEESLDYIKL